MSSNEEPALRGIGGASIVVTRKIRPGKEADYEGWCARARAAAAGMPGFVSASLVPGHTGSREYTQTFTFVDEEHMTAWADSPERASQIAALEPIVEGDAQVTFSRGMSAWLNVPGEPLIVQPPMWKVYVVSTIAIYPLVVLFANYLLLPYLYTNPDSLWGGNEPVWFWLNLATLVNTAVIGIPMTWVTMPLFTWLLRSWLERPPRS